MQDFQKASASHTETWRGFCRLIQYSVLASAGVLVLLALFLL